MKKIKIIYQSIFMFSLIFFVGCEKENYELGNIVAPSNIEITSEIVGVDENNPNGDGSGTVHFNATSTNALTYKYIFNGEETLAPSGKHTINFSVTGTHTYVVTVVAVGTGGTTSMKSVDVKVFANYSPQPEFLANLTNNSSRTWKQNTDVGGYVGVGPAGGDAPIWYTADPNSRADTGSDDDTWTFTLDGKGFTHTTNGGTAVKTEYAGDLPGGTDDPKDDTLKNFPLDDYSGTWNVTAPGGVETISLSGIGFFSLYTGTHDYTIVFPTSDTMELTTTDANGRKWWYKLIAID
jgi:hypothetical protein